MCTDEGGSWDYCSPKRSVAAGVHNRYADCVNSTTTIYDYQGTVSNKSPSNPFMTHPPCFGSNSETLHKPILCCFKSHNPRYITVQSQKCLDGCGLDGGEAKTQNKGYNWCSELLKRFRIANTHCFILVAVVLTDFALRFVVFATLLVLARYHGMGLLHPQVAQNFRN